MRDALTRERVRAMIEKRLGGALNPNCGCDDCVVLSNLHAALDDPARWCGIVGVAQEEYTLTYQPSPIGGNVIGFAPTGRLIVTPHQEGA